MSHLCPAGDMALSSGSPRDALVTELLSVLTVGPQLYAISSGRLACNSALSSLLCRPSKSRGKFLPVHFAD